MTKASKGGNGKWCCTARLFTNYNSYRCHHPAKHDPDENGNPTKCGVHSSVAKAKRESKREARRQKELSENRTRHTKWEAREELIPLVRSIANGHNDPRQACQEWLDRWGKLNEGESK